MLVAANFNCPGQIVLSGSKAACERAVELAGEFECRAVSLPVAGAFHSPLMDSAAEGLRPMLAATEFATPAVPTIANVNGEYHTDPAEIRELLRRQVTEPVRWQRCMERFIEEGVDRFVEMGPGRVLTGLMRKINRKMTAVNVSTADGITQAATSLSVA